ncbi:hypothetical protein CCR75_006499 [Bremia lactucae]|uniref:HIT-type domain-containing protein n=1 Tax=Bremia lactucae TaxID=4779 RepID=A0A976IGZ2_BRELC|nr:hypothetical protein CCR75_006499 [Bremia lactucae]
MTANQAMESKGNKRGTEAHMELQLSNKMEVTACFNCGKSDVKYRCPRCECITCSLHCCVAHKKKMNCSGKRNRTKFVEVKKFTDSDLSSDFFFLEEVSRSASRAARSRSHLNANVRRYTCKKRRIATNGPINPDIAADWIARFPNAVQIFADHSEKRGISLTLLAPGMSKRSRNSSYMDTKKNTMFWRVEWVFPSAEVSVNYFEKRANERETLFELLAKYLSSCQENLATRGKLKKYAVLSWKNNIELLLRKEFTSASQPQFYRLNGNQSLESNLKRKAIVEFPVIIVALASEASNYPIVHDLIEMVPQIERNATEQQFTTDVPKIMELKDDERSSIGSTVKCLTSKGSSSSTNLLSVLKEENDDVKNTV